MRLRKGSAFKIKRMSQKRKIICFGAGDTLVAVFEAFRDLRLEERVVCIVDNDSRKWGEQRNLNGKLIEICPPENLNLLDLKHFIIVITALRYHSIFAQLQNIAQIENKTRNNKIICFGLPFCRNRMTCFLDKITRHLSLKNYIVFQGEGDSCENAMALGEYLKKENFLKKYKLVWLCSHPDIFTNKKNEKFIQRETALHSCSVMKVWEYCTYRNRAKYLIYESQIIEKGREDQISIYLNHGSPPIKATKGKIILPEDLNYAVCPSENCADILSEQYSINKERLLYCGSPRTDCLFSSGLHEKLKLYLEINSFQKIILWVPTFRQHYRSGRTDSKAVYPYGVPVIQSDKHWEMLQKKLDQNKVLLIMKPHLLQDLSVLKLKNGINIKILTQKKLEELNATVYDMMKMADAMITDYSTVGFDFMLLNRMIGYTIDDMEEYELGFSVEDPLEYMPGHQIKYIGDMINFIQDVAEADDRYQEERKKISTRVHKYEDGNNSKRLVEMLGL